MVEGRRADTARRRQRVLAALADAAAAGDEITVSAIAERAVVTMSSHPPLPGPTRHPHLHDRGRPPENRLDEAIGYVTPDDEQAGRGEDIRQARIEGLRRAHEERLAYHRRSTEERPEETSGLGSFRDASPRKSQTHLIPGGHRRSESRV